jgi:hypothetical protein
MTALFDYASMLLSTDLLERQFASWTGDQQGTEYRLQNAYTHIIFELTDGRSERFDLAPLVDMEYRVFEPVPQLDGGLTVPLEILRFENSAISEVLWPGERLTVRGGVRTHVAARPIYGMIRLQPDRSLEAGVLASQTLWSRFWTPVGELVMGYPANMTGVVTRLEPPLKARQYADRPIPLFGPEDEHVATIYNCTTLD